MWLSARPVTEHPRLLADTVEWLGQHGLPTEYVYWSDFQKHAFIVERFPTASVLFDDKPETIQRAAEFGLRAYVVLNGDLVSAVNQFLGEAS